MKKTIVFVVACFVGHLAEAQWTTPNSNGNINSTNSGSIGIGTTVPQNKLHVIGNVGVSVDDALSGFVQLWADNAIIYKAGNVNGGLRFGTATNLGIANYSEKMRITDAGRVGIGTSAPSAMLEVGTLPSACFRVGITSNRANCNSQLLSSLAVIASDNMSTAVNGAVAWDFYNNGTNPSWAGAILEHVGTGVTGNQNGMPAGNQGQLLFQNVSNGVIASNGANIFISPQNTLSTCFLTNGNVGIGTTNPGTNKLAVEGTIGARKVVVVATASPFPDYVFDPGYLLPSLDSVGRYIQAHHHLAEIPSADSVARSGLDLGGNQAALLKKIEELTLYIIEQGKKSDEQNKLLKEQSAEVKVLEERIARMEKLKESAPGK